MIFAKCEVTMYRPVIIIVLIIAVLVPSRCQREPSFPINAGSFSQIIRAAIPVPSGRAANVGDIHIKFYSTNFTKPSTLKLNEVSRLLTDPRFNRRKPTVLYTHGYVELTTDKSVHRVVRSYLRHGGYNTLVLDWANLAFGNYVTVAVDVAMVGKQTGRAISRLIKGGLSLEGLHFVGHSLGVHVMAYAARALAARGFKIPRLTGLDPAYPGFYPPALGEPVSKADAVFVDMIHTDGGGYGAPSKTGHVDFWPNGGQAKQPGCLSVTILLTSEDFCSHWRSWAFWAESVDGGQFLAQRCDSYDSWLRGRCRGQTALMGLQASAELRGNYYLRTAASHPYSLGIAGAS